LQALGPLASAFENSREGQGINICIDFTCMNSSVFRYQRQQGDDVVSVVFDYWGQMLGVTSL
jgi:hypothetical protein